MCEKNSNKKKYKSKVFTDNLSSKSEDECFDLLIDKKKRRAMLEDTHNNIKKVSTALLIPIILTVFLYIFSQGFTMYSKMEDLSRDIKFKKVEIENNLELSECSKMVQKNNYDQILDILNSNLLTNYKNGSQAIVVCFLILTLGFIGLQYFSLDKTNKIVEIDFEIEKIIEQISKINNSN